MPYGTLKKWNGQNQIMYIMEQHHYRKRHTEYFMKTMITSYVKRNITEEVLDIYSEVKEAEALFDTLANLVIYTGNKIIMIIDEWDAPIRENGGNTEIQREYLLFLRSLFKNSGTTDKIFAAVYMTGILPIKKDGSQFAISDFEDEVMV